jgi:TonB family protein
VAAHTQATPPVEADSPVVIKFVAPPYPRAAKDKRIIGRTVTRLSVDRDGSVMEVKTISANPLFEGYVLDALKQWRFKPSDREYTLEVTCLFELDQDCEGTNLHPVTSETHVSAELPSVVHVKTGLQCIESVVR